ncbi:TonB family C-terminal domain-containing protein [Roseateles sp. YR242]|uniref:energy transducer TonB n=1 Tax=Roseateles sp. YR242 TaxID=1855305 RepID=UPI0008AFDC79|nr:energy transducer TonB [Roseateles sp. YR242]SEK67917.1 TonB family C-terminal domain-containing protein [Roseateles sp. YR242]
MSSRSFKVIWPSCLSVCLLLVGGGASAQTPGANASSAAGAAATDPKAQQLSDVERAKRDADKVFQWIKFHAEKGETKKADKPDKPEKHEAKAEPKAPTVVAKAAAPARKAEDDSKTVAAAATATPADTQTQQTTAPAFMGRVPEVMAMAAPATTPVVGTPALPQPEPEPAPVAEEESPLRLLSKVDPEYPRSLLSQQRNGSVMVKFTVQPDGSVDAVEATKSPDRKLSAAAIAAVKQWRFAPVNKPRSVSVEIGFQMD